MLSFSQSERKSIQGLNTECLGICECETWAIKVEDMARLERTKYMMVRWMCCSQLKSRMTSAELNSWLGIE